MKRKLLLLCTLLLLLAGILGAFLTVQKKGAAFAAGSPTPTSTPPPTTIFQDNFDSYTPGPLPTGTGATQWTSVKVTGTGFAVAVSKTVAKSKKNSLQFTLGSGSKGNATAIKQYSTKTATHAVRFSLYLDPTLTFSNQAVGLIAVRNFKLQTNGAFLLLLTPTHALEVVWYDSTGVRHNVLVGASSKLTTGVWYTIELDQSNNATTGSWSLYLNKKLLVSKTAIDTGSFQVNSLVAGDMLLSISAMSGVFYEDDIITSTQHIG